MAIRLRPPYTPPLSPKDVCVVANLVFGDYIEVSGSFYQISDFLSETSTKSGYAILKLRKVDLK